MRLLLINQYFWPDKAATSQLLADLAEDAVAAGHEVNALAGRARYVRDGARLGRRERWRGVDIRRCWSTDFGRSTILGRITDYVSFLAAATIQTLFAPKYDVVVCLSTPPFVALLGLIAKARGARFVYKVEDLYPDVAVALSALKRDSLLRRLLEHLSRLLLRRADLCIALDATMARRLESKGARRIEVIANWADGEAIRPDPEAGKAFRKKHGIGSELLVLYAGNLGHAHRFDAILAAARRLERSSAAIRFLFVGGGPQLEDVRAQAEGSSNVSFLPYQPREELNQLLNAGDLHLVSTRDEVAGLLVPSKYASALAAGRPVLVVGGEGTDLNAEVAARRIGWICTHDVLQIVAALEALLDDRQAAIQAGARARHTFETHYARASATRQWIRSLDCVLNRARR